MSFSSPHSSDQVRGLLTHPSSSTPSASATPSERSSKRIYGNGWAAAPTRDTSSVPISVTYAGLHSARYHHVQERGCSDPHRLRRDTPNNSSPKNAAGGRRLTRDDALVGHRRRPTQHPTVQQSIMSGASCELSVEQLVDPSTGLTTTSPWPIMQGGPPVGLRSSAAPLV